MLKINKKYGKHTKLIEFMVNNFIIVRKMTKSQNPNISFIPSNTPCGLNFCWQRLIRAMNDYYHRADLCFPSVSGSPLPFFF